MDPRPFPVSHRTPQGLTPLGELGSVSLLSPAWRILLIDLPTPAATAFPDLAPAAGVIPRLLSVNREPLLLLRGRIASRKGFAVPLIACMAELTAPLRPALVPSSLGFASSFSLRRRLGGGHWKAEAGMRNMCTVPLSVMTATLSILGADQ